MLPCAGEECSDVLLIARILPCAVRRCVRWVMSFGAMRKRADQHPELMIKCQPCQKGSGGQVDSLTHAEGHHMRMRTRGPRIVGGSQEVQGDARGFEGS